MHLGLGRADVILKRWSVLLGFGPMRNNRCMYVRMSACVGKWYVGGWRGIVNWNWGLRTISFLGVAGLVR